jgi:hypothetical protein
MDDLAKFLPEANWRQRGQHTSICDDNSLEPILAKYVSELPAAFRSFGFQAWRTMGTVRLVEGCAYILPIKGSCQVVNGPSLSPGSEPFYFEQAAIIYGSVYFILAAPKHCQGGQRQQGG